MSSNDTNGNVLNELAKDEPKPEPKMKMIVQKPDEDMLANNKAGDTTFEMCGWCKHAGSGMTIGDCFIHGACGLIPWEILDDYDWLNVRKHIEYDDDMVKKMTRGGFKELLKRFKRQASQDKLSLGKFKRNYRVLTKIHKKKSCHDDPPPEDFDHVSWGITCIIMSCLGNNVFREMLFTRYEAMFILMKEKSRLRDAEMKRLSKLRGKKFPF